MTGHVHRAILKIDVDSADQADNAPRQRAPL